MRKGASTKANSKRHQNNERPLSPPPPRDVEFPDHAELKQESQEYDLNNQIWEKIVHRKLLLLKITTKERAKYLQSPLKYKEPEELKDPMFMFMAFQRDGVSMYEECLIDQKDLVLQKMLMR